MKKRLFPLIAGIFIGSIVGVGTAFPTVREPEWLSHGLYNTAIKSVMQAVNHRVWIACVACYIVWAALSARRRMNGWIRRIPELVAVTSLLVACNVDIFRKVTDISSNLLSNQTTILPLLWKNMYTSGGPQIIAAVVVLVVGMFALGKIRRKPVKSQTPLIAGCTTGKSSYVLRFISSIDRFTHGVAQGNWGVYAIVLVFFTGMNLASFGFDVANAHAAHNNPNIILIQIDTLRPDHLGCYGYQKKTSPNIDKLASDSMRFEKAIATAPWTAPSVAQYMTGRYLRDVRFEQPGSGIPVNVVSMAGALKEHGYSTAGVNTNMLAGLERGFAQGFDTYDQNVCTDISSPYVFSTAVKRLNDLKNKKFFMFLLFLDVHSPYLLHEEHNFYPDYKGKLGKKIIVKVSESTDHMSKDDLKYMRSVYDSEIAYTDVYIGKLMDELKKMKLYDDTLIILLGDHGEEFGEHGRLEHGKELYDESISVPLIIKLPGQHKGSKVGGVFPLLDLFPSIMDTLNIDSSSFHMNGVARHLKGLRKLRNQDIYSATNFGGTDKACILAESNKLIFDKKSQKLELYSLENDPAEKQNVQQGLPSLVSDLSNRLKSVEKEIDETAPGTILNNSGAPTDQNIDRLKTLGYL